MKAPSLSAFALTVRQVAPLSVEYSIRTGENFPVQFQ